MVNVRNRKSIWRRIDLQLSGAILFAAVIPSGLRAIYIDSDALAILYQTLTGVVVTIIFGTWLLRNITTYPGIQTGAYVIPVFTIAYFSLLMVFVLGRLEYNRLALAIGYGISICWFVGVHMMLRRDQKLRIGYLPHGDPSMRPSIANVSWIAIRDANDEIEGLDAVAADLRIDLPSAWDRRLADFALASVPVFHIKALVESLTGRVQLEHLSENSFGSLIPLHAYMSVKHLLDWVAAAVLGVALFPFLILVAVIVRLDSPGPALFRQTRIGFRGIPFKVYKFRTMHTQEEPEHDELTSAMTQIGDARITRLGRFLRRTRIDELPQIMNILRGEMSWIGPRPEAEPLSRWYESQIPFYRYRHIVRPGLAGWAQVCQGHVTNVEDVRSKLHYDFYYIKNFSPWIDLLIVARTAGIMVTGFGAR